MQGITRRTFLGRSGRAAAAGVLAGTIDSIATTHLFAEETEASAKPKAHGAKMRYGLVTYLWGADWDLPTLIANCTKAGVLGVELRTTHKHGVEPRLGATERAEVKKRFADSAVTLVGLGSNERFDHPDPKALSKAIDATQKFILLSRDVGGSGVKVKPDSFHEGVPKEKTIEQIGGALKRLGKFAADHGQEVRLEMHGQCAEPPTIKAIMDVADHPAAVVCWNSNKQDLAGKGLEHNFDLVKGRFGKTAHVRQFDYPGYPWAELIALFVKMDYDGWILAEAMGKLPKDRVAALRTQQKTFAALVTKARG